MEKKTVDVIIPVYRPGKEFGELLRRLEKQEHRPEKIMVMNTGRENWNAEWEKLPDPGSPPSGTEGFRPWAEPGRPAQHFLMQIFWYS